LVRGTALTRIGETGSTVVRIPVNWRDTVLPEASAGFDPRDPGSPGYRFGRIDAAVVETVARGLKPLLVISHAPAFAEAPGRWPYAFPGSWAPSPQALEDFAVALARRYDGAFPDPQAPGVALPRVSLFQAWNEPNLARYLEPQWIVAGGRWSAFSPLLYRQMLDAFYAGVKSVEPSDLVLAAGLAPNGEPAGVGRMAPVSFLRAMLCLTTTGARAPCPDRARFDVLAFHPLSVVNPDVPAASALDVAVSDAGKITHLLARAEHLHTVLPVSEKAIWVTELNWESAPQAPHGVPEALQARWISRALHRLWVAGVSLVQWQFLVDPYPGVRAGTPTGGAIEYPRPAGLYSAASDGDPEAARPKAFLRGFTLPFDPLRLDAGRVRLWALLMAAGERVALQRRVGRNRWRTVARLRGDSHGVLNVLLPLRGPQALRLRDGAGRLSATAVPSAGVSSGPRARVRAE
jgi:hypothetical protein